MAKHVVDFHSWNGEISARRLPFIPLAASRGYSVAVNELIAATCYAEVVHLYIKIYVVEIVRKVFLMFHVVDQRRECRQYREECIGSSFSRWFVVFEIS